MTTRSPLPAALAAFLLTAALAAPAAHAAGPGILKFDETSFEVAEGVGMAIITVERSKGETGAVSVDYRTSTGGSAAPGADYTPVQGTLTWPALDGGNKTFVVPIHDDAIGEGRETILLVLDNPTGGASIDSERGTSTLAIGASDGGAGGGGGGGGGADDGTGGPGVLKFDETSFEVLESVGVALITVERSQGESGAVSVGYRTVDGSATAGDDYTSASGTLSWFAGDGSNKTFVVPILEDGVGEDAETIGLELVDPTGGATIDALRGTSTLVILGSDGGDDGGGGGGGGGTAGTFKFGSATFQTLESGGSAIITVERSGGENGAASVRYTAMAGTATDGADFVAVSGTLSWNAGNGADKTFVVPILADADAEGNETVLLVLDSPTGGATLHPTRSQGSLTIVDDDAGAATGCVPSTGAVCLLGGRFRAEVRWRDDRDRQGAGKAIAFADNTGLFWFYGRDNIEVLLKVLDGCTITNSQWVFFSATTNVEMEVIVTDTRTGRSKSYFNALGQVAESVQDLQTFDACN